MRIDGEPRHSMMLSAFFHMTALFKTCVSQGLLSPRDKPQRASIVATTSTERYRFGYCPLEVVEASSRWLILGLAIAIINPFNCCNAERFRMHIKIYIFLHNPRQIKLPALHAPRIQITRLSLKYIALYYIATT